MKLQRELDHLVSEAASLASLLRQLPAQAVIERFGLERRLADVQARLTALQAEPGEARRLAQVAVAFDGEPVRGTMGIDAEFGGTGVAEFQKLVALAGAARSRGRIKGFGRIPDEQYCRFQITGTVEGSFGFLLEEDPRVDPIYGADHVAESVEEVNGLLAATTADDEQFVSAMSELDPRVRKQLAQFLKVVASNRATVKVTTERRRTVFHSADAVEEAFERVNDAQLKEEDIAVTGVIYYLPVGRRFEIRQDDGSVVSGPLAVQMDSDVVKPLVGNRCTATVRAITVVTRGKARLRHILLAVAGLDTTGSAAPDGEAGPQ
jgi:hypothetical protein